MSHLTTVKMNLKDLDAVERAGGVLGFDLRRDQRTHEWFGEMVGDSEDGRRTARERGLANLGKCDHALRARDWQPGDYEIGVVRNADETYSLLFDSWGPGQKIERAAGRNLARFRQEYAVAVTEKRHELTLARKGFRLEREAAEGGRVRLRLRRR